MSNSKKPKHKLTSDDLKNSKLGFDPLTGLSSLRFSSGEVLAEHKLHTYITKEEDGDYHYRGVLIELPDNGLYRTVFECLFDMVPGGGFVSYEALGNELRKRIPTKKSLLKNEMSRFILENLKEHNGFLRYAKIGGEKIPTTNKGGQKLIEVKRGKGIQFNNKM